MVYSGTSTLLRNCIFMTMISGCGLPPPLPTPMYCILHVYLDMLIHPPPPPPTLDTGSPPLLSDIETCSISVDQFSIKVQCTYPSDSLATGFQVIAHLASNSSHRLYVEETTHTTATATVEVEETGVYQVSIFPLREGTGILDSNVEYTQQVDVSAPGGSNTGAIAGLLSLLVLNSKPD